MNPETECKSGELFFCDSSIKMLKDINFSSNIISQENPEHFHRFQHNLGKKVQWLLCLTNVFSIFFLSTIIFRSKKKIENLYVENTGKVPPGQTEPMNWKSIERIKEIDGEVHGWVEGLIHVTGEERVS